MPRTRKNRNQRKRKLKGGGGPSKKVVCERRKQSRQMIPGPVNLIPSRSNMKYYESLIKILESLKTGEKYPPLILKIGSNDSSDAEKEGSKGKKGIFFIEFHGGESFSIDFDNPTVQLLSRNSALKKFLKKYEDDNPKFIAISPEKIYDNYEYPFLIEDEKDKNVFSEFFGQTLERVNCQYVKGYFPLAPASEDLNSINQGSSATKLLNLLVNWDAPLIIFNAMGSWCYQSIKYILDLRDAKYKLGINENTIYCGLVDSTTEVLCGRSTKTSIYPNYKERCGEEEA